MKVLLIIITAFLISGCGIVEPDFITKYDMEVTIGEKNNPNAKTIEIWTKETMDFWRKDFSYWDKCMYNCNTLVQAFFVDEKYVTGFDGNAYAGLTHRRDLSIEISNGTPESIRYVFIHELSHVYLGECEGVWSVAGSHAMFEVYGLK